MIILEIISRTVKIGMDWIKNKMGFDLIQFGVMRYNPSIDFIQKSPF